MPLSARYLAHLLINLDTLGDREGATNLSFAEAQLAVFVSAPYVESCGILSL